MRTLLLNDTSSYHNGCKEAINNLKNYYSPTLFIGTLSEIDTAIIEDFDLVVLNGEGTMHHNAQCAVKFLNYIKIAQKMGKITHIVNTVWQDMQSVWNDVLKKCSVLEVREVLSQKEMSKKYQIIPNIVLDASIHSNVNYIPRKFHEVCLGSSFYGNIKIEWNNYHKINIFSDSWVSLVNQLKCSKLLITGRHHEMYAALKARTPCIAIQGNTWKNQGFFETVNCRDLCMQPTYQNIADTLSGKYNDQWNKVWDFLDNQNYKYII